MGVLWLNLATVFGFSLSARYFSKSRLNIDNFVVPIKASKFLVFFAFLSLVFVSGLRSNIGDTNTYINSFQLNVFTWETIREQNEIGFALLQMGVHYFTSDAQVFIFTCSFITLFLIVSTLYNYSRLFELSIFVFITSGMYLVSMNGIRQYLAASIIFAGTKFLLEGKFFKYTTVILIASTIHQSAIVLLPVYFIVRREAWSRNTMILLCAGVIGVAGYNQLSEIFFAAISNTDYGAYANFQEGGANVIRVAVTASPLILAYLGRVRLKELFPKSDYIVNLCLLGVLFMVLSTQQWIFARFAIYFDLFNLILISWVVKTFQNKNQTFVYYMIIVLYLMYFIYEYVITLNIEYRSDYITLL
ncbi:capsular biosynthesis protein [Salipaludibacillus neizhouensis]|uniref:Capsular biosynthesis protein n=1 Tax=Salipaludibacillus neizhouensis TaxID=885475 RepID=A0A3A9K7U6_9BACI|nr:EpsG family protein [Salipaludibacillus neizhouensis]RKL66421.1 capsular biosynthesis protein [Salipaludibacillus neizhouensis]